LSWSGLHWQSLDASRFKQTGESGVGPGLWSRTVYDFDKSPAIGRLIEMPLPVSGVIIKECAAYFQETLMIAKRRWKNGLEICEALKSPPHWLLPFHY